MGAVPPWLAIAPSRLVRNEKQDHFISFSEGLASPRSEENFEAI